MPDFPFRASPRYRKPGGPPKEGLPKAAGPITGLLHLPLHLFDYRRLVPAPECGADEAFPEHRPSRSAQPAALADGLAAAAETERYSCGTFRDGPLTSKAESWASERLELGCKSPVRAVSGLVTIYGRPSTGRRK